MRFFCIKLRILAETPCRMLPKNINRISALSFVLLAAIACQVSENVTKGTSEMKHLY